MQDLTEAELSEFEIVRGGPTESADAAIAKAIPRLRLVAEVRRLRAAMEPVKGGRLYAQRDSETLGAHYIRHVEAMTDEGLHEKSAIAAELAWRDALIAELRRMLEIEGELRLKGLDV